MATDGKRALQSSDFLTSTPVSGAKKKLKLCDLSDHGGDPWCAHGNHMKGNVEPEREHMKP